MGVDKNEDLAHVTGKSTTTTDFEHNGTEVVVEYVPPSVEKINETKKKHMTRRVRGQSVEMDIDQFEMELDLLDDCLEDSNIPGIPEGGKQSLREIRDWELWQKLLQAVEIVREMRPDRDEIIVAAEEVVAEFKDRDGPIPTSVKNLHQALQAPDEEADIKKS